MTVTALAARRRQPPHCAPTRRRTACHFSAADRKLQQLLEARLRCCLRKHRCRFSFFLRQHARCRAASAIHGLIIPLNISRTAFLSATLSGDDGALRGTMTSIITGPASSRPRRNTLIKVADAFGYFFHIAPGVSYFWH